MNLKQIKTNKEDIYIINNTKFISIAYNVNSELEVKNILDKLEVLHHDASHICYGFKVLENNQIKEGYYEAKEPKNSSGKQIFNLINNKEIINVLVVVVRYFSGKKLGIGLLSRSYLNAAKLVVEDDNLIDWIPLTSYLIQVNISEFNNILYLLKQNNIEIIEKEFNNENVKIKINLNNEQENLEFINKYKVK